MLAGWLLFYTLHDTATSSLGFTGIFGPLFQTLPGPRLAMLPLHLFVTFFGSIVFGLGKIPHVFVSNPFGDFNPLFEIDNPRDGSSSLFRRFLSSFGLSGLSVGPFGRHDVQK